MSLPEARPSGDRDTAPAARSLLRALSGHWLGWSSHSRGQLEFGGLSEETDGEGRRHRIEVIDDVDSVLVRGRHVDGRAVVALWIRRHGCGWTLDMAWRGRHDGELAPKRLIARQLAAYVAAADPPAALVAAAELAPKASAKDAA